jgi:hypothetical protein
MVNSLSLQKPLQWISYTLHLIWVFFPGILILTAAAWLFQHTTQGIDIITSLFQSPQSSRMLLPVLLFWALVTWYSSRLISYHNFRKYYLPEFGLTHFPRFLGFHCLTVLIVAFYGAGHHSLPIIPPYLLWLCFTLLYFFWHWLIDNPPLKKRDDHLIRRIYLIASFAAFASSSWLTFSNHTIHWILLLPLLQVSLLTLIILRKNGAMGGFRWMGTSADNKQNQQMVKLMGFVLGEWLPAEKETEKKEMALQESYFFIGFSLLCLFALGCYCFLLSSIELSRQISPLPILLLGFGLLLGAGNILSMLSFNLKINFHFIVIAAIILAGFFRETHWVKLMDQKHQPAYTERPALRPYFNKWMAARSTALSEADSIFPVYLVMADGGASRSAYWTASVLSGIDSIMKGSLYRHMFSLSGSSGGSLGNLAFIAAQKIPQALRSNTVQKYLSADFLSYPLVSLLGRDILLPLIPGTGWSDRAGALEQSLQHSGKAALIDSFMQSGFSALNPDNLSDASLPVIFVNCTRMQDGTPAALSNIRLDKKTFGQRIDILRELKPTEDISVASSIVLGARFPVFSPAGRIRNNYFVDAGYLDNSGAGITHELLMDLHAMITDSLKKNPGHPYGKIRFQVLHITNDPVQKPLPQKIHPLLNDLAAPVMTLSGTHARQTDYHNLRLKRYLQEITGDASSYKVINLYENGWKEPLPMNWTLSPAAIEKINKRLFKTVETITPLLPRPSKVSVWDRRGSESRKAG